MALPTTGVFPSTQLRLPFNAAGRRAAVQAAGTLLSRYALQPVQAPLVLAGALTKRDPIEYVVAALADEPLHGTIMGITEVPATAGHEHAALALAAIEQILGTARPEPIPLPPDAFMGSAEPVAVAVEPMATAEGTRLFDARTQHDASHHDELRRALDKEGRRQATLGDHDMSCYLCEVRDQTLVAPLHDIPQAVRGTANPTNAASVHAPYHLRVPYPSDPLPSPRPQRPPAAIFHTRDELHVPGFLDELAVWFTSTLTWLIAVWRKDAVLPVRPDTFVAGQEVFVADAKGLIWDCRRADEGIVTPLDTTQRPRSTWDTEWLRTQWAGHVDQEMVSHACDGADLKVDPPLQYVFTEHLFSLAADYATVLADLTALVDKGFYAWFSALPFCPGRYQGQGTRLKGDGWRRIASGSCPYHPILDGSGVPAHSLNANARRPHPPPLHDPWRPARAACLAVFFVLLLRKRIFSVPDLFRRRRRFRKERKTSVTHAVADTYTLRTIGDAVGEPVFYFLDDFAHFFYQIVLRVHCWWYSGIFMLDPVGLCAVFFLEKVMAMGYTPCSNIAQMVCDGLLDIFDTLLTAADAAAHDWNAALDAIMAERARRHGQAHGRPWTSRGYTDDVLLAILGVQRTVRAITVWHGLLRKARILGASHTKRQCGTWVHFLGVTLYATALFALVPEHKRVRALLGLWAMRSGTLERDLIRKLLGLLVHLAFLSVFGRASTAGMWECLRATRSPVLYDREVARVDEWIARIERRYAVTMDVALRRAHRAKPLAASASCVDGQSDAFREPPHAGWGGYAYGDIWHFRPPPSLVCAPITCHEFLAVWAHLIINAKAHALVDFVCHFTDNFTTFLALARDAAAAPFMRWIYDEFHLCAAIAATRAKLRLGQRWGAWLLMADAASREHTETLALIAQRARITLRAVTAPPAVHALAARAASAYAELQRQDLPPVPATLPPPPPTTGPPPPPPPPPPAATVARRAGRRLRPAPLRLLTLLSLVGLGRGQRLGPSLVIVAAAGVAAATLTEAGSWDWDHPHHNADEKPPPPSGSVGGVRSPVLPQVQSVAPGAGRGVLPLFAPLLLGVLPQPPPRHGALTLRVQPGIRRDGRRGSLLSATLIAAGAVALAAVPLVARVQRRTGPLVTQRRQPGFAPSSRPTAWHPAAQHELIGPKSGYAMRPADPVVLHELFNRVDDTVDAGINANTANGERSAWTKYFVPFCKLMRTPTWRGPQAVLDPAAAARFLQAFTLYVWEHMAPRRHDDMAPRVQSTSNVVGHIRRALDRKGHALAPPSATKHLLKGLVRKRLREYGVAMPVRAEPFTAADNIALKSMRDGQRVGTRTYDARSRYWANWNMVDTFGDQSGSRKSEVVGDHDIHYRWSDVQLVIGPGDTAPPSASAVERMVANSSYITVVALPSKADNDGTIFGPNLMTFLYNPANPMSFAASVVRYLTIFGTPQPTAPVFTTDGERRWTASLVDSTLAAVMAATLSPARRVGKTYHSKRVWLASALMDRKSPEGEIQALVRWSSAEALRLYARMHHLDQARKRDNTLHADVNTVNAARRPRVDYTLEELHALEALADAVA